MIYCRSAKHLYLGLLEREIKQLYLNIVLKGDTERLVKFKIGKNMVFIIRTVSADVMKVRYRIIRC